MTQAYYRSWRPLHWGEIVGQQHIIATLRNAISNDRVVHAYLFAGPRGTGKTTTARVLAKAVNCLDPNPSNRPCNNCDLCREVNVGRFLDLIEIDAASNTSVEDVRELRDKIGFSPSRGAYKIYIIDEVHMLSGAAFNALLKTLEEPPSHAIFILATTELQKIPATILSRCQRYEFRRIPVNEIVTYLRPKIEQEKIEIEESALLQIARQATGSMRDAISLLDQLASGGQKIDLPTVQSLLGTAVQQSVVELIDSIRNPDPSKSLQIIQAALDTGTDPRQYARQVVDCLRSLIMLRAGNRDQVDLDGDQLTKLQSLSQYFDSSSLLHILRSFNLAALESRSWQPGLALEIAVLESFGKKPAEQSSTKILFQMSPEQPKVAIKPESVKSVVKPPTTEEPATKTTESPDQHPQKKITPASDLQPNLNMIIEKWQDIFQAVNLLRRNSAALLRSSKPMIKNGTLTLGFQSDLLKSKMEAAENLEVTKEGIQKVCGFSVAIQCEVVNSNAQAVPADLGVDSDGMVGTGLNQGGRIVHKD